jgi:alkylation response protein AidB-like acyl-CoA dehydrogenase
MNHDSLLESTLDEIFRARAYGDASDALAEFGLADLIEADTTAVAFVHRAQGVACATSNAINILLGSPFRAALGDTAAAAVLSVSGAPGADVGHVRDGVVSFSGVTIGSSKDCLLVVPICEDDGKVAVAFIRSDSQGVHCTPTAGIDPALGIEIVVAQGARPVHVEAGDAAAATWSDVLVMGRCALAAEIVGNASSALAQAIAHAKDRVQFGRPVGSFQAVKHRLAEVALAVASAEAAITACITAPSPLAGLAAKSVAGRAGRITEANCLQVLGATGFTAEHPFHRHQKRMVSLDQLLGSAVQLPRRIGAEVRAASRAPILVHLGD